MPSAVFAANYPPPPPTLQSSHAGIRREAGRTRALRNDDGRPPRAAGGHDGPGDGRDVPGGPTRGLLPKPAMAGETGAGYPDRNEEPGGCEGTDSECDGRVEEEALNQCVAIKVRQPWAQPTSEPLTSRRGEA